MPNMKELRMQVGPRLRIVRCKFCGRSYLSVAGKKKQEKVISRPTVPCGRPRMNPSLTVGTRRDPLGISAWRSIAHRIVISSRVPVHSVLVQKSVTTITNVAGRLSALDARETPEVSQAPHGKKLALHLPVLGASRLAWDSTRAKPGHGARPALPIKKAANAAL